MGEPAQALQGHFRVSTWLSPRCPDSRCSWFLSVSVFLEEMVFQLVDRGKVIVLTNDGALASPLAAWEEQLLPQVALDNWTPTREGMTLEPGPHLRGTQV